MEAYILVVEDEEKLARFIELELTHEGYKIDKAHDGRIALDMALEKNYDLILLDIMLPGLNGLEVLRRLGKVKDTPVILLTARDAVMDKVSGLDQGAVDYITKPFAIEELLARIRVVLKLYSKRVISDNKVISDEDGEGIYKWSGLVLNTHKYLATYNGEEIELTNREFIMLECLLRNLDIVMSRDELLYEVCGYDYVGETNIIDVYVRHIRSKIDEHFNVKMIQTVRGVGYVIRGE